MLVKVVPPSVETCHCTVGVGLPVAAAVKVAGWPALTNGLVGLGGDRGRGVHGEGGRMVVVVPDRVGEHSLVLVAVLGWPSW